MKYYDISPILSADTAVFPGDEAFSRKVVLSFAGGQNFELSNIQSTVHIGAHADAPSHYHPDGVSIEKRSLSFYLGLCQVIRVKLKKPERILPYHIKDEVIQAPRVLFSTNTFPNPNKWRGDFASLSPELIEYLKNKNVRLVGLDTPSVDPADSKPLESHAAIYRADMAILEGLVLDAVPAGLYQLISLPLPILGGDASPVRAILLPQNADLSRL